MPRRTITIGASRPQFQFQDDFGPLNNGLGYFAGQWLASGRDRAQIEMQREATEADRAQHVSEREQDVDFRNQDLELRRLALGNQDEDRQAQRKFQGDELEARKAQYAAENTQKWADKIGSVAKYGLDWMRGGNPAGGQRETPANDLSRDKFHWDRAVQEIGNPDHDLEVVDDPITGVPRQIRRPLTPEQREDRVRKINQRFDVLRGVATPPAAAPAAPAPTTQLPHRQTTPYTPEMQSDYEEWRGNQPGPSSDLSGIALGGAPAQAPTTPATSEHARAQFTAGAGGWGMFPGANFTTPTNATPPPTEPMAQPPQDPRARFTTETGINPHPSTGITVDDFVGQDDQRRVAALRTLPPQERLKAIATLRAMGFQ